MTQLERHILDAHTDLNRARISTRFFNHHTNHAEVRAQIDDIQTLINEASAHLTAARQVLGTRPQLRLVTA